MPAETLGQLKVYGLLVAVPNSVVPLKNSTLVIVPSLSEAIAETVMFAGAVEVPLFAGAVRLTDGGTLANGMTVMLRAPERVAVPELSVALAVKLYVPAGTPVQLNI